MKQRADAEPRWIVWLREELRMGVELAVLHRLLREKGMPEDVAQAGLEAARPRDSVLANGRLDPPPLIRRAPPQLRTLDAPFGLHVYDDFLSAKDCARVSALIAHHLRPSTVAHAVPDDDYRTSQTCELMRLKSPAALELDAKIVKTIGIRASYGEGIQAQRYDVGQQFKPHCDYFEPGTPDYERFAAVRGNRTWTFMVYLNDGMEGGATRFTHFDCAITPKAGMAVLWNNLLEDGSPNPATMHCGEPVTRGHKVIVTKWFRVRGDGPPFTG